MRAAFTLIITLSILAGGVFPVPGQAQSLTATPSFVHQDFVAGVSETKFPHLTAGGATVHMAANVNRLQASYWSRAATAPNFGSATVLGPAEDQPDYSTTAISSGPDGSLYYVWVNQPQQTIYLRSKAAGATEWNPAQIVASRQVFPVFPEVAVASDGAIFVAWRNPDRPFVWRRSTTGGASWGAITDLSVENGVNTPALATGPNGAVAIAYTAPEGDNLQIFVATWNGTGFTSKRISSGGADFADPSLSFAPDGTLYVAWRGIAERGVHAGVFFAERKPDGSYPIARLIDGKVAGRVNMIADANHNLHMIWTAAGNSNFQLWYAVKSATGSWSMPVVAPAAAGIMFNAHAAVTRDNNGAFDAHAATEVFVGSRVLLRQYRFQSGLRAAGIVAAVPIAARSQIFSREDSIPLQFAEVVGDPTQVRYRWDAPPNDGDPWLAFAAEMRIPAPKTGPTCQEHRIYTQVRNAGAIQAEPVSAPITLDRAVQARVRPGASSGGAGMSNNSRATWLIEDAGECAGLAQASTDEPGAAPQAIIQAPATISFRLPAEEGAYTRSISVTDVIGNSATYSGTFIVDATAPQLQASAPLTITADPTATVLQTIDLTEVGYQDRISPLPWAAAIAISPEGPITAVTTATWINVPLDPSQLRVAPAAASESMATISTQLAISMAALLGSFRLEPGTYHYAVALVDGAGNRSESWVAGSITLDSISYPSIYMPLLQE
ncbi:MAG: exo-alpha-sialidase [Oscillochloris sp.]|nr:exo-alpha-sialidase [Oscillochloris sp.]